MMNLIARARVHVGQHLDVANKYFEAGEDVFDIKMKAKAIWDFVIMEVATVEEYKELSTEWNKVWEPKFQAVIDSKEFFRRK